MLCCLVRIEYVVMLLLTLSYQQFRNLIKRKTAWDTARRMCWPSCDRFVVMFLLRDNTNSLFSLASLLIFKLFYNYYKSISRDFLALSAVTFELSLWLRNHRNHSDHQSRKRRHNIEEWIMETCLCIFLARNFTREILSKIWVNSLKWDPDVYAGTALFIHSCRGQISEFFGSSTGF